MIQKRQCSCILSSPELKAQVSFSDRLSVCKFSRFHHLFQNHWANFNQTWSKASLFEGIQFFFSNDGRCLSPREDNYKMVKMHWHLLKIFFFRTTGPILNKLGTEHPCVKEIQICKNEGPHPFISRGGNCKRV